MWGDGLASEFFWCGLYTVPWATQDKLYQTTAADWVTSGPPLIQQFLRFHKNKKFTPIARQQVSFSS